MGADAVAELVKQGGLAVGFAGVMILAGWIIKLLKDALDRQEKRNDAMREDLSDLTEAEDKLVDAIRANAAKIDALNARFDNFLDRRRS